MVVENGSGTAAVVTNGNHDQNSTHTKFIDTIDPEDPQYRRDLQRPPDVKEDMRQMESRQRVSSILNSQAFREELESIIADQLKHGPHPASLIALQQISDLLLPNAAQSRWHQVSNMGKSGNVIIPINDIRGIDSLNYSKGERLLRCKLASLSRLIDLYGWSNNSIDNCLSIRLNPDLDHYLVNPYGLMHHEVSASSLIKIDINSNVIEHGSTTYGINKSLFVLHSAIYKARPDVRCIMHVHTPSTQAVSMLKCGLLALSQESVVVGGVSYHDFKGIANYTDDAVHRLLADDVGPLNKIIFVRNYGVLACGETIEEAWHLALNCVYACETQLRVLNSVGGQVGLLNVLTDEQKKNFADARQFNNITILDGEQQKKWKNGELEFEACMRCLDNAAYRTGYVYRQPVIRSIDRQAIKDVEIPPTCSSYHSQDPEYLKKLKEERQKYVKNANGDWLLTPNAYAKQQFEETGPYPKKVTKWLAETSPNKTSTPVRIDNKNQFAPQGENPKELKNQQKQLKQDRYDEKRTPGYQSRILENILGGGDNEQPVDSLQTSSHEGVPALSADDVDATRLSHQHHHYLIREKLSGQTQPSVVDYQTSSQYSTGSPTTYVYGAVSKGIIKRDQQNNSGAYKSIHQSPNPFQQIDNGDIEKYKKEIAQKQLRDQVQRKDKMHEELLREKSSTVPRATSLAEHKRGENGRASSGSSRETSPTRQQNTTAQSASSTGLATTTSQSPPASSQQQQHQSIKDKSATLSTSLVQTKPEKPKKKSKLRSLSFLKSSKKTPSSSINTSKDA